MFQTVRAVARDQQPATPDVLVLAHWKGQPLDERTLKGDKTGDLAKATSRPEATGDNGSLTEVFPQAGAKRVLVLGLGEPAKFTGETFRAAIAALGRRLSAIKATSAHLELGPALAKLEGADLRALGSGAGEALGLLSWNCDTFRGKGTPAPTRTTLAVSAAPARLAQGLERGLALSQSANYCRTLSQTPPNVATPAFLADEAAKLCKAHGMSVKVFQGNALVKERFQGLINVGKASENKPCLIRMEYAHPQAKKDAKPLVLVGKAMTYDTGGLSLKINNGMVGMKRDKDGGCAVLGAMHAIATIIKPKCRVVAYLASAENSLSDEAYRPDDVITYRNGVTVEVTNTDAEGRLVLADALCYTCEKDNPAAIIDLATLTGGVITALGSTFCGMFCEDDKLRSRIEDAAKASGERVWRLPMHQEYRDMMKSPIADMVNSNPNRKAHPIQGAAFLAAFVTDGVPWCHLDIAGVHVSEKNAGMFIEGPTGWGVRLLAELAADW